MAQRPSVTHTDDLDGGRAVETVCFALDGIHYEIDLSARNAKAIRKAFAEFVAAGRLVRRSPAALTQLAPASAPSNVEIRAWAAANDVAVSTKGRIGEAVRQEYNAAHATTKPR